MFVIRERHYVHPVYSTVPTKERDCTWRIKTKNELDELDVRPVPVAAGSKP
jgi:hypothetical protein